MVLVFSEHRTYYENYPSKSLRHDRRTYSPGPNVETTLDLLENTDSGGNTGSDTLTFHVKV